MGWFSRKKVSKPSRPSLPVPSPLQPRKILKPYGYIFRVSNAPKFWRDAALEGPVRDHPFDAVEDAVNAGRAHYSGNSVVLDDDIDIMRVTIQ